MSLGWTGRSAVGWVATIRNRERGRKWAEQEEIDKGGGGGTGGRALTLRLVSPACSVETSPLANQKRVQRSN